jgi:hypothetical protein
MGTKKFHPVRYSDGARKSKHKSRIPGVYVGDERITRKVNSSQSAVSKKVIRGQGIAREENVKKALLEY